MKLKLGHTGEKVVIAGKPFAGGGEGNLYKILSPMHLRKYVAKLYHPHKITKLRQKKITYLAEYPPVEEFENEGEHPSVTWVKDSLYKGPRFVGFIMPYVRGEKLEILCTPRIPRKLRFQWKRFSFGTSKQALELRLRLAFNVCAAIHQVHASERYILVDMKPDNIVIQPNGLVSIVDTDSVEVIDGGDSIFDAPVATPEYTPPEHYQDLDYDPTEKAEWDRFGLGVILYKLFFGIHPFAASSKPPFDHLVSLHDKIREGLFVHHPDKQETFQVIPPPHKKFYELDPSLQELFMRCFVDGHYDPTARPTAEEWCAALLYGMDDEAAFERYGHILGAGKSKIVRRPRLSLPSTRFTIQQDKQKNKKLPLEGLEKTPQPVYTKPLNREMYDFGRNRYSPIQLVFGVIGFFVATAMFGGPIIPMIGAFFILYNQYSKENIVYEKGKIKNRLNHYKRAYRKKKKQLYYTNRSYQRSIRRIVPRLNKLSKRMRAEIKKLNDFLANQDAVVKKLEKLALDAHNALSEKYLEKAMSNRVLARVGGEKVNSLSKIRIAINKSKQEALRDLTQGLAINDKHPVYKKGKIEVEKIVKEKRLEIKDDIESKIDEIRSQQDEKLQERWGDLQEDADILENISRLWKGKWRMSALAKAKVKSQLEDLKLFSVLQIRRIDLNSGLISLMDGRRINGFKALKRDTMMNLYRWFDEIRHEYAAYKKVKSKVEQKKRIKIKDIQDKKKIEIRNLKKYEKKELQKVKLGAQKEVLGQPFEQLEQQHQSMIAVVDELEEAYAEEQEESIASIMEKYEQIMQEAEKMAEATTQKLERLEAQMKGYRKKINQPKIRRKHAQLEKQLEQVQQAIKELERASFEKRRYKDVNFFNYVKQLFKRR